MQNPNTRAAKRLRTENSRQIGFKPNSNHMIPNEQSENVQFPNVEYNSIQDFGVFEDTTMGDIKVSFHLNFFWLISKPPPL